MDYEIKLNEQQLAVIGAGLQELPFKVAVAVINELNDQIVQHRRKAALANVAPPAKAPRRAP